MATIPIYDQNVLPCMSLPMRNTNDEPKKYMGGIAVTGEVTVTVQVEPDNDAEANVLYSFWKDTCNFGLEPFLAPIPLFGRPIADQSKPDMLVKFVGRFNIQKDDEFWTGELKLKLIGTVDYIIDAGGDFIVSNTGEYTVTASGDYMPTGNEIYSFKKVIYG